MNFTLLSETGKNAFTASDLPGKAGRSEDAARSTGCCHWEIKWPDFSKCGEIQWLFVGVLLPLGWSWATHISAVTTMMDGSALVSCTTKLTWFSWLWLIIMMLQVVFWHCLLAWRANVVSHTQWEHKHCLFLKVNFGCWGRVLFWCSIGFCT